MIKLFVLIVLLSGPLALAQGPLGSTAPVPPLSSRAYLLIDFQSRQTLAARNPDDRVEPASLTKLLTAYVVFDALRQKKITLVQPFGVSQKAWQAPGSRMFLTVNESVPVEELLNGMIVQSGNDAAIALAEGLAGSEEAFVQAMNRDAVRLGLKNSHFVNATGLPNAQHFSTASDLVALSHAIIDEFPQYFAMYKVREHRHNNITQYNRNRLLGRDPFVDGMKTGYTESAGYCMVATAQRNDRRLIAVVIDAGSENGGAVDAQKLLNYGFEAFDTIKLYSAGQPVHSLPVWKGNSSELQSDWPLIISSPCPEAFPNGSRRRWKACNR